jgi:hypothetical protein
MKLYRKKGLLRAEPWHDDTDMQGVSISDLDKVHGSPRDGDMIATNADNPKDRWLISKNYFEANYELAD